MMVLSGIIKIKSISITLFIFLDKKYNIIIKKAEESTEEIFNNF